MLILLSAATSTTNQFQRIPQSPKNVRVSSGAAFQDNENWLFNCRRCKVYIRTVSGGGGGGVPSSGKKTNVGAVVAFASLLVVIVVGFVVCIYKTRYRTQRRAYSQQGHVEMTTPGEENLPQQPVVGNLTKNEGGGHAIQEGWTSKVVEGQTRKRERARDQKVEGQMGRGERARDQKVKGKIRRVDGREGKKQPQVAEVVEKMGGGVGRDVNKQPQGEEVVRKEHGVVKDGDKGKQQALQDDDVGKQYKRGREENGGQNGNEKNRVNGKLGNSLELPNKYTYKCLSSMTNNFDPKKKIGEGGFGNVYKARLPDGTKVAIKCLKLGGRIDDFKNEVDALGKADHPNLVKLIGYCAEGIVRLLVYEYMRNGSLEKWIFHRNPNKHLSWPEMKNIIQGIAQGLVYLHENCEKKILHRDLKPHNVVLDENKNAKLCDFGVAKFLNKDQTSTSTNRAGTDRYMAPEVQNKMRITDKIDVYSFGIVVLEVMFGEHYRNQISTKREDVKLNDLVMKLSEEMQRNGKEIEKFGKIAVWSLRENPEKRPTMLEVLSAIQGINAKYRRNW